ncbi:MAG: hypothetical protein U9R38_01595 [Candidatus Margulisiibacteriota bacterium]|nr:hypothetical protein [Candidatus Margulisiibacteriota bacterium]
MRKLVLIFLMVGLIGVSGAFAQYKPMLATNGVALCPIDFDGGIYINLVGSAGNKLLMMVYNKEITAKMIDNDGNSLWEEQISSNTTDKKEDPMFVETSDGNIIFAWTDYRRGGSLPEVVMRKYDMSGTQLSAEIEKTYGAIVKDIKIAPDDNGGFYLVYFFGGYNSFAIDRYDGNMTSVWSNLTPLALNGSTEDTRYELVSGGSGVDNRAFVVYSTNEATSEAVAALASTVSGNGKMQYQILGNTVEFFDTLELGGKFFVVQNSSTGNIVVQRLGRTVTGVFSIEVSKAQVCYAAGRQSIPKMVTDGSSLCICWLDERNYSEGQGNDLDIYIQKSTSDGVMQWLADGLPVTHSDQGVKSYSLISANNEILCSQQAMVYGDGRVYLAWHDFRMDPDVSKDDPFSAMIATKEADIYMQAVNISDGSMLNSDLPVCSAVSAQILPSIFASSPFAAWVDLRDYPNLVSEEAQRADNISTAITSITTSPASANMVINGVGFGVDPNDYVYSGVTYGSEYNYVSVNGSIVGSPSWTPTAITFDNYTYNDFLAGPDSDVIVEVMAYGDTDSITLSKPSSIIISDIYFDGDAYSTSGQVISKNAIVTGEITSVQSITSSAISVDGSASTLTLTNDAFSYPLSSLSSGDHAIIISAIDSKGGTGSTTCNVSVSSVITISESSFNDKSYQRNDYVNSNTSFRGKVTSDYSISELKLSVGTGSGAEIDVLSDYDNGYLEIADLGVHINLSGDVIFTLRAKDSNGNETSQVYYVSVAEQAVAKDVVATDVSATQDARIGFNYGGQSSSSGSGIGAAATGESVKILLYGPSGKPIMLQQAVTIGYNEVTLSKELFDSNGIYIVKIYDGSRVIGKTRIVVLK